MIGVSSSSVSSSEINDVGVVVGCCEAEVPDKDICSCCAAISCVLALYVPGTLFGNCGIGDKQFESISLSSLDR